MRLRLSLPSLRKGCKVVGIDMFDVCDKAPLDRFIRHDLNAENLPSAVEGADYVLVLDVLEHLTSPERFVSVLRSALARSSDATVIISVPNIAFVVVRLMLLVGQFNYGKKGILDLTHTRLFTFDSLRALLQCSGFQILSQQGVPVPIPMVVKNPTLSSALMIINRLLIRVARGLFSYQILVVAKPLPSLDAILEHTRSHSHDMEKRVMKTRREQVVSQV